MLSAAMPDQWIAEPLVVLDAAGTVVAALVIVAGVALLVTAVGRRFVADGMEIRHRAEAAATDAFEAAERAAKLVEPDSCDTEIIPRVGEHGPRPTHRRSTHPS